MREKNLKLKAALVAMGMSVIAIPASAQLTLDEIIVTAQKRDESLQDVPISIQVLSGKDLAKTGALDFEALSDALPNVEIVASVGVREVSVRGLGSGAGNAAFEQSVGLYIDGIYASRVDLFQEPFTDIDRIEVLKGPQGVLLGKNSVAGALVVHSAKPTDTFEGSVTATYDFEHDSHDVTAVLSGPLSDTVSARIAVKDQSQGAFIDNDGVGNDGIETNGNTIRGSLLWQASEGTEVYLKVETSDSELTGSAFQQFADFSAGTVPSLALAGLNQAGLPAAFGSIAPNTLNTNPFSLPIFFASVLRGEDFVLDDTQTNNEDERVDQRTDSATLKVTHSIGDHELIYTGGFATFDRFSSLDQDFAAADLINTAETRDFTQQSHEIRIASPVGGTFEYIAGLYYLDREFDRDASISFFGDIATLGLFPVDLSSTAFEEFSEDTTSQSAFAQVTWNISDRFRASLGGRYSKEEKDASFEASRFVFRTTDLISEGTPEQQFLNNAVITPIFGEGDFQFSDSLTETSFDPSLNVQWNVNYNTLIYASVTKATKAGGFDVQVAVNPIDANTVPDAFQFNEEKTTGFELGVKLDLLDGRARLNAAIFRSNFDDLQISSFDPAANGGIGALNTGNAGAAVSQGIEVDGLFAATDNLTIGANFGYLKAEYTEFITSCAANTVNSARDFCDATGTTLDLDGFQIVGAPKVTAAAFVEYAATIGNVNAGVRLDANHKGETILDPSQDTNLIQDSFTKFNINFSVASTNDTWFASLGAFNLTDEQPLTFGGQAFSLPGAYFLNTTRGREIKATVGYNF